MRNILNLVTDAIAVERKTKGWCPRAKKEAPIAGDWTLVQPYRGRRKAKGVTRGAARFAAALRRGTSA